MSSLLCDDCDFVTSSSRPDLGSLRHSLWKHQLARHATSPSSRRLTSRKRTYELRVKAKQKHFLFICDDCDFQSRQAGSGNIVKHVISFHLPTPPQGKSFRCDECGHRVKEGRLMGHHMAASHSVGWAKQKPRPLVNCDECGVAKRLGITMLRHWALVHASRRSMLPKYKKAAAMKVICDQCRRGFNSPKNASKHMTRPHK